MEILVGIIAIACLPVALAVIVAMFSTGKKVVKDTGEHVAKLATLKRMMKPGDKVAYICGQCGCATFHCGHKDFSNPAIIDGKTGNWAL